jgi:hypothetical protein
MNSDEVKNAVTHVATAVLAWAAGRYHLSPDQVGAMMSDAGYVGTGLALAAGWYQHFRMKKVPDALPAAPAARPPAAVIAFVAVALGALLVPGAAHAQANKQARPALTGDPVKDIGNAINQGRPAAGAPGDPLKSLADKIAKLSLEDFKYAAALAHATGNNVTAPCWDAWVTLLTSQQQPLKDAAGNPVAEPDPHLITDAERLSEAIQQLQPNSAISIACAPAATAVQKDAATLISQILGGSALNLFKLPIPIP